MKTRLPYMDIKIVHNSYEIENDIMRIELPYMSIKGMIT